MTEFILAIDAGTTGIRVNAYDGSTRRVESAYREFAQHFPEPGWVEHDAGEIWEVTLDLLTEVVGRVGGASRVAAIGITNQRETTVAWDRATGSPLHRAIVWQDRRTKDLCEAHRAAGREPQITERTGLLLDAYFSGTKIEWLIANVPDIGRRAKVEPQSLAFGTIDSWLAFKLSGGQAHVTDPTNASRTLLFDIDRRAFTDELAGLFSAPLETLPRVVGSAEIYGESDPKLLGEPISLCGLCGDQQSALFGQGCYEVGSTKNTYGTGCFALLNCGTERPSAADGILTTIACDAKGDPVYALEGSVFIGGAVIQWLRDGLGVIESAEESEGLATSVDDTGGVYFVPAFTGLGAPYWDMDARGAILGITRGTKSEHIVRAALEAIAFQSKDLLDALESASGRSIETLRIDGGAVRNNFLAQFQADILDKTCVRPSDTETTARGAALLAGLGTGFYSNLGELRERFEEKSDRFTSTMDEAKRSELLSGWGDAVSRVVSREA